MGILCWILGHGARGHGLWNEGYFFTDCRRCSCDLIRTDGSWSPLPHGYRVIWKTGFHRHAVPSDFKRNLPLMPDEPRRWRLATHWVGREVLCLPGPEERREKKEAAAREQERSGGLPQVLLFTMLTALGLAGSLAARRR